MPAKHIGQLCKRCNVLEAALTVRTEPLCRDCFSKYVHTKVVKRMEAFKTRNLVAGQERKLLLPVSFGVSSISLLHILHQHLQSQRQKTGRTGFSLHVVYIHLPDGNEDFSLRLNDLRKVYPEHEYSTARLEDVFVDQSGLSTLLQQLPSASSIADILSILRTRLVVKIAKTYSCEAVLFSDSTTKLAEKVLAETAKGRGFSLPWQVADGPSPFGMLFYYPLRDILKKELIAHANLTDPPLSRLMDTRVFEKTQAPPSAKNTTIDVLMKQYFEDVEEAYPSIVSNVVRTTGKLHATAFEEGSERCKLCESPVEAEKMGIEGWGGYQEVESNKDGGSGLCYGCSRSLPAEVVQYLP
jgi:cytoplasmic tRNA 2-thiolation protein 2